MKYFVDDMGVLWKGPVYHGSTYSNMHYAFLDGVQGDNSPCWIVARSEEPENSDEVSVGRADEIIARHVSEFSAMKDR